MPRRTIIQLEETLELVLSELSALNVLPQNVCVVGSFALRHSNIDVRDIDLILRGALKYDLGTPFGEVNGIKWEVKIGYLEQHGIGDEEIFEKFSRKKADALEILPELELARKTVLARPNDVRHLEQITASELLKRHDFDFRLLRTFIAEMKSFGNQPPQRLSRISVKLTDLMRKPSRIRTVISQRVLNAENSKLARHAGLRVSGPVLMDIGEVVGHQIGKGKARVLLRLDLLVRFKIAVEMVAERQAKFEVYEKMISLRKGSSDGYVRSFEELVKSVKSRGFNSRYPILVNPKGSLLDGAHRLAISAAMDVDEVPVKVTKGKRPRRFDKDWFLKKAFQADLVSKLELQVGHLLLKSGLVWPAVIWPGSANTVDSARAAVRNSKFVEVLFEKTLKLSQEAFEEFVLAVYEIDDVDGWKIAMKIANMRLNMQDGALAEVHVIGIFVGKPKFRIKQKTGQPISSSLERLKSNVRKKAGVEDKLATMGTIIHVTDNYSQNRKFFRLQVGSTTLGTRFMRELGWTDTV